MCAVSCMYASASMQCASVHVCMYRCVQVCMYVCIDVCVQVCKCASVHVCMYV